MYNSCTHGLGGLLEYPVCFQTVAW